METKHTPQGVIVSRSLLPKEGSKTFVKAVNLSDQHCALPAELCVGSTYPAVVVSNRTGAGVTDPPFSSGGVWDPPFGREPRH